MYTHRRLWSRTHGRRVVGDSPGATKDLLMSIKSVEAQSPPVGVVCLLSMRWGGYGSPVVKVSDHGRHVMSSSPVPLKTRRVGQRCTLNLSRAETSSLWCGVIVRRGDARLCVVLVT
ncbi:uncharacterized protein TNCV_4574121 [Trichonephila clavipes]|nr:uncharacterized protein TNCV_4574121 [Trichonephila clavipes]